MVAPQVRRPVLVVAPDPATLRPAFATDRLRGWEPREADFLHARFLLQCDACDVMLLDGDSPPGEDVAGLVRLAARQGVPVVVLSGGEAPDEPDDSKAVFLRLPRHLALAHPALLGESLDSAARCRRLERNVRRAAEDLRECRRRADRLAGLLWEAAPAGGPTRWFTQRYLMGRLEEELARAERRHAPLSVVVGDVHAGPDRDGPDSADVRAWVVERIARGKRRSDVAGQYGPTGFLLLLPDTADAGATACCRRLQGLLREPRPAAGPASPRVDFGIATYPTAAGSASLLSRAEERLEEARGAG